ncbi:hypothetical protein OG912_34945 [Streptomyces sp. NBC_00464]|uniref:hypothetical protein n=1 Tax=Streptomyces sp. NBC_00464 TaxID=2975751 RepID=UPI002E16F4E8
MTIRTVLYTAELYVEDRKYTLVVNHQSQEIAQTVQITRKAVDKLPDYLSMLRSRAGRRL